MNAINRHQSSKPDPDVLAAVQKLFTNGHAYLNGHRVCLADVEIAMHSLGEVRFWSEMHDRAEANHDTTALDRLDETYAKAQGVWLHRAAYELLEGTDA